MAELEDVHDLGLCVERREGSTPSIRTKKMEKEINKIIRQTFNKYLVKHVPIKDDNRFRTEIMFEEMTNEVVKILNEKKDLNI